jgi:uncharacterized protein YbjT (DUF2867 family)
MIVVVGGSGELGRRVVRRLLGQGERVRVVVRDADRARHLLGAHADVVEADVRRPSTIAPAVAGAAVVVSAVHGFLGGRGAGPVEVDHIGGAALVDVAAEVGADVVLVSVLGAGTGSLDLFRAKYAAEEHLRASGTGWTIVRAGPFLETWLEVLSRTARDGRPLVLGRGTQPLPFVSVEDVADVVAAAATHGDLRGRVVEVAGEPLTMTELAHALQGARGWEGPLRHVPRPVLAALGALARPVSPAFARQNRTALAMDREPLHAGAAAVDALGHPVRSVLEVLAASGVA